MAGGDYGRTPNATARTRLRRDWRRTEATGPCQPVSAARLALMGLLEVLRACTICGAGCTDGRRHRRAPSRWVVTIDSPGFMLRLLKAIQSLGVKRVHYVAPQVWAWREGRCVTITVCGISCSACCPSSRPSSRATICPPHSSAIRCWRAAPTAGTSAIPGDPQYRSCGAGVDPHARQPSHRGWAAAADPWRHIAAPAGCCAGGTSGHAGRACRRAGRAQLAAAAGAGHGAGAKHDAFAASAAAFTKSAHRRWSWQWPASRWW